MKGIGQWFMLGAFALAPLLILAAGSEGGESSKTNPEMARALKKYPKADADGDGTLTQDELKAFMAKMDAAKQPRKGGGVPAAARPFYETREYAGPDGRTMVYHLMKPKDYDAAEKYPLVLSLHGAGGNSHAAWTLAKEEMRERYPCFVLAPEAREAETWGPYPGRPVIDVQPLALAVLAQLQEEFSIDPKRLYVTGQSMGGFGTYAFLIENPDLFAAGAPICGRHDPAMAEKIKNIPLWIFHGDADTTISVDYSREMVKVLQAAGGDPKYTEFPGVGHNSWTPALAMPEFWDWMFAQRKE